MNSASLSCAYAAEHGVLVVAVGQPMPSDSSVLTSIYPAYYEVAFENGAAVARDCFDIKTKIVAGYIMIVPTWHTWGNGYIAGLYYTRMEQLGTPVTKEEAMIKGYEYYLEFFDKGSVEIPEANMEFAGYIGDGGQDQTGAMAATESLLTAIPDLNLLLPINDFQAAGGVMALENNGLTPGKDVIVVASNDGSTEALENIRDGKLYATSNSAPELMGASAVDLLHMIFAEDYDANDLLAQTLMPVINLNSSNWEEYYVQDSVFAKKPSQPVVFKTTREAFSEFLAAQ
jgi:ribose transport system substrate-binding protein